MRLACFDLETTSTDTATAEVVQAALVRIDADRLGAGKEYYTPQDADTQSMLFHAADIPAEATAVHGITVADVADALPFGRCVRAFVNSLTEPDTVAVTYNGCGYDIPIVARYAARAGVYADGFAKTAEGNEEWLRSRHIDVMRLWSLARMRDVSAWYNEPPIALTSAMFAGTLTAAHGFYLGYGFDWAHDAAADCHATLAVLDVMLSTGLVTLDEAIKVSTQPLPGDVDFEGKFKWRGDQAVISFGKHAGTPLECLDAGYLRWMLKSDFPPSTRALIQGFMSGSYPVRDYEAEL